VTGYACLWVPRFAAVALVRSDPRLRGQPVAAMTGTPATRSVLDVTPEAWACGVRPGMSAGEAAARAPGLVCRDRDDAAERSAAAALLDVALATSPRVERAAPDRVHLDLAGVTHLFGTEARLGARLARMAADLDLPARVAIAGTRTAAALAARATPGVTVVPRHGEPAFLSPLLVDLLAPSPDLGECLERWGIRTLGQLARLPTAALLARLGLPGTRLQALARGADEAPFVAHAAPEPCVEALALEWEVVAFEALVFVLRRLLERLVARLALRELGATALILTAGLANAGVETRRLGLVAPVRELRTLLALLRADLEGWTLPAPIVALALEAETAPLCAVQPDLFEPKRPSPHELAQTLGQLCALVGRDRVGAPVLGDTHRPTAIGLTPFGGTAESPPPATRASLACRRFTPPLPAAVAVRDNQPRRVAATGLEGPVVACAGPWRTVGEWWTDTAWSREEWDVALPNGAVYRLVLDRATGGWTVDAVYD
jgi:protein ImuB